MIIAKKIISEIITQAIDNALNDNLISTNLPQVKVEVAKDPKFGDYATPVAMESAKILRRSPIDIGNILKEYICKSEIIEDVEIVKPGFINIFLSLQFLSEILKEILQLKDDYGKQTKENPVKINLEFVSANPTGPLNVVSARAAAIGDTMANLITANGDIVHREFYINDFGNQVRLLGISVHCRYQELRGEKFEFPEEGYQGEYVKDIAKYIKDNYENEIINITDKEKIIDYFTDKAIAYNITEQKKVMSQFNVEYQEWFSEKSLHESGKITKTFDKLNEINAIYEEEGKKIFKATDYGDDKDRVVVRDDGRPTYILADIAYHIDKFERGYDNIIDIWGPDHHGYITRLKGAMLALNYKNDKFKILIAQQVNLLMKGELVKMSKRLGQFSTMQDLIDEIGADVSRYFFIMRSLESHLDFDLELAKKQSSENPVFYLQYAHARICSIFSEAKKRNITCNNLKITQKYLNNSESITLLKLLSKFPEEISDAAESLEPHRIANYLLKAAQAYHKFYNLHRVLSDDLEKTNTYLCLCDAVRIIIKNGLKLLGVSAPERM